MDELEVYIKTTHMEINTAYENGDNEYGTKRFQ